MDSRTILRMDIGVYIGIILRPQRSPIPVWDPCPSGQPKILTVAHPGVLQKLGAPIYSRLYVIQSIWFFSI